MAVLAVIAGGASRSHGLRTSHRRCRAPPPPLTSNATMEYIYSELLAQEKAEASASINQEVDLDELMDDPELEKLHAERIATLKLTRKKLKRDKHWRTEDMESTERLLKGISSVKSLGVKNLYFPWDCLPTGGTWCRWWPLQKSGREEEDVHLGVAHQMYKAGNYKQALEHCNAVYESNPLHLYYQLRDFEMCIAKNEEALRIEPHFGECYGNIANAWKVVAAWAMVREPT
ncbi:uncharacterized protein LOC127794934 isoform X2 [Diospyros lotus]|uniref:uncharacterized protein LOC127794934 isoform X2 n=1 Tax=Diospyros lotus TaxID=55363 RepID=UPI002254FEBE|nr:uncharacterized protein LOC127794934 isoform X2 [Diospyros lotus]